MTSRLGIAPSTVHRNLVDARLSRLSHVDRSTGEPVRSYEHDHPGAMIHVDVKKLGNIPDGGGWRYVGRRQGEKNRAATQGKPRNKYAHPLMGKALVHTVTDDHSRVAHADLGVTHKRTRPYRPQTNGRIERFHRTLADGRAYARCYASEAERRDELDGWTTTTTTGHTRLAATSRRSHGWPTSPVSTAVIVTAPSPHAMCPGNTAESMNS